MASTVAPETGTLRREIQEKYSQVATNPEEGFHFHTGRYAIQRLGYPMDEVDRLPAAAVESFAGVGNPMSLGPFCAGETVVDIGSGAGFDSFLAAMRVGPGGKVIGVDMTDAMLEKARRTAVSMGLAHVEFRKGLAEELPVEDASVDVVSSNGVINLCPDKYGVFREAFRILKPGGRLYLADVVLHKDVGDDVRLQVDLWTA